MNIKNNLDDTVLVQKRNRENCGCMYASCICSIDFQKRTGFRRQKLSIFPLKFGTGCSLISYSFGHSFPVTENKVQEVQT